MPQTFVLPRQVALDDDANPMSGAFVYFFQTGTTTPQAVFVDAALTTQHEHPVPADSAGRFPKIYLDPQAPVNYRARITTSGGIQLYQEDDIERFTVSAVEIGRAIYPLTSSESDAGITPTNYTYEPGSVLRYGADPTGVVSSRTAFVNAALAYGYPHAPAGTYLINESVSVPSNRVFSGDGPATIIRMTGNNLRAFRVDNATNVEIHSMAFDGQKPSVGWETSNNFDFGIRVGESSTSSQCDGIYIHDIWLKDIGLDGIYVTNAKNVRIRDIHSDNCRRWAVVIGHQSTDSFGLAHASVKDVFADCTNGTGPVGKEYPLGAVDCEPDGATSYCDFVEFDGIHTKQGSVVMSQSAIRYSSVRNIFIEDSRLVLSNGIKVAGPVILKGKCHLEVDGLADSVQTQGYLSNIFFFDSQYSDGSPRQFVSSENLWPTDVLDATATNTAAGTSGASITRARENVEVDGCRALADKFTYPDGTTGTYLAKHQITANLVEGDQVLIFLEIYRTDSNSPTGNYLYMELGDVIRTLQPPIGLSRIVVADVLGADATNPTLNVGFTGTPGEAPAVIFRKVFFYVNPAQIDERSFRAHPETYLFGEATFNPGSLADGAGDTTTVTVTGAAVGDYAMAAFSNALQNITVTAWVSAANTVSVRFQNESGGVLDLASGTLRVRVLKS